MIEKNRPILAIDDDEATLALYRDILGEQYNISTVYAGRQALDLMRKQNFALVILDLELPVMTGIELVQQLHREFGPTTPPILVVTAYPKLAAQLAPGQVQEIMSKPFDIVELQNKIQELVNVD